MIAWQETFLAIGWTWLIMGWVNWQVINGNYRISLHLVKEKTTKNTALGFAFFFFFLQICRYAAILPSPHFAAWHFKLWGERQTEWLGVCERATTFYFIYATFSGHCLTHSPNHFCHFLSDSPPPGAHASAFSGWLFWDSVQSSGEMVACPLWITSW